MGLTIYLNSEDCESCFSLQDLYSTLFRQKIWDRAIYGWARYQPMREDVTCVTSSLIGWYLAQPMIEEWVLDLTNFPLSSCIISHPNFPGWWDPRQISHNYIIPFSRIHPHPSMLRVLISAKDRCPFHVPPHQPLQWPLSSEYRIFVRLWSPRRSMRCSNPEGG